jgi:hypothetical protein
MNQIPTEEQLQSALELLPNPLGLDEMLDLCLIIGDGYLAGNTMDNYNAFIATAYDIGPNGASKKRIDGLAAAKGLTEGMFSAYLVEIWLMVTRFLLHEEKQGRDPFIAGDELKDRFHNYSDRYFNGNPEERILIEDKDAVKRLIASKVLKKPLN